MTFDPDDEKLVKEWLVDWEEHWESGRDVPASHLAADRPDLMEELAIRIAALKGGFEPDANSGEANSPPRRESAMGSARYVDLRRHAGGGIGEVFEAHNPEFRRQVALKFLKGEHVGRLDSREQFLAEAEVTGRLEHPGIVPIYGLGADNAGHPCYAMRFIRGLSMEDTIRALHAADALPPASRGAALESLLGQIRGGRAALEAAAGDIRDRMFRELLNRFKVVCDTIAYAHDKGVIHRDLKPANVMLGKFGETLVIDWGLAKYLAEPRTVPTSDSPTSIVETLTLEPAPSSTPPTFGVKGTPAYMSPEQAAGRRKVGPRSDVYSLGATLYSLLVGVPPFRGDDALEVVERVLDGKFIPPRQQRPDVPIPLDAICRKAMSRDPDDRYGSAGALADDVENWLSDRPTTAWKEPRLVRFARWARRHREPLSSAASSLLVLALAMTGATLWYGARESSRLAASGRDVRAALNEADGLAARARSRGDSNLWSQAVLVAEGAARRLDPKHDAELSDRVSGALITLRRDRELALAEDARASRDRRMVADLDAARMPLAEAKASASGILDPSWRDTEDAGSEFDFKWMTDRYKKIFVDYGIDIESADPAASAAAVRASAIRPDLCAALDDWALRCDVGPARARLLEIARKSDPDPVRATLRDAVARKDRGELIHLAGSPDVEQFPPPTILLLAWSLQRDGEIGRSLAILRRSVTRNPGDFWSNFTLASYLAAAEPRRRDEIVAHYTAALALRPGSVGVRNNLGIYLGKIGRLQEGVDLLRQAMEYLGHDEGVSPESFKIRSNLGGTLALAGQRVASLEVYRSLARDAPRDPNTRANLGLILYFNRQTDRAIEELHAAIDLDPDAFLPQVNMACVLLFSGRAAEAKPYLSRAATLRPKDPALAIAQSFHAMATGDDEAVISKVRETITLGVERVALRRALGLALGRRGRHIEALTEFLEVIRVDGSDAIAWNGIGAVQLALGQAASAEPAFRNALANNPKMVEARSGLCQALVKLRRGEEAIREAREAVALTPDNLAVHENLGMTLAASSLFDEATEAYRGAARIAPRRPEAHLGVGNSLMSAGHNDEAAVEFLRALECQPDFVEALFAIGEARQRQGRFAESLEAFRKGHEIGSKRPGWRYPSMARIRNAEGLLELDARSSAILARSIQPQDEAERLRWAVFCVFKGRHAVAVSLYREAFANQPKLVASIGENKHRQIAAYSAALAAGQGRNDDPAAAAELRRQAIRWLSEDLSLWREAVRSDPGTARAPAAAAMREWKSHFALASIRDPADLQGLADDERRSLADLWAEVDSLRMEAELQQITTAPGSPKPR